MRLASPSIKSPFHQKSSCLKQLTFRPYVVQIWSRTPRISAGSKPSNPTEWRGENRSALSLALSLALSPSLARSLTHSLFLSLTHSLSLSLPLSLSLSLYEKRERPGVALDDSGRMGLGEACQPIEWRRLPPSLAISQLPGPRRLVNCLDHGD